jgi:hypothetical protein
LVVEEPTNLKKIFQMSIALLFRILVPLKTSLLSHSFSSQVTQPKHTTKQIFHLRIKTQYLQTQILVTSTKVFKKLNDKSRQSINKK